MYRLRWTLQFTLLVPLLLGASATFATTPATTPVTTPATTPATNNPTNERFGAQWQAKLCTPTEPSKSKQPHINFSFQGPITEVYGPLCYHFAGYNETCLPAKKRWLTPATTIELIAPGQVPVELLQGYILLVRFPWHSDELYRYPLANTKCLARRSTNSS